ncbi:MAG TPA: transcriptional repressor LexA [Candidatus Nitrosotenuis sp.]|jgi:repressor LexA|nr:transcriptional repressor LexA [Candidatus Nitrosotenuis sp.]
MDGLSPREREILTCILDALRRRGYPPSVREIAAQVGLSSPQAVQRHLDALERKGLIQRDSKARALRVAHHLMPEASPPSDRQVLLVPLVGRVAAGRPLEALEDVEDHFPVPAEWLSPGKESFFLTVQGDSMAQAILPGDLVLVEPCPNPANGEIVVALIDQEATVKRYHRQGDQVILRADNPAYADIIVTHDLRIAGRVRALVRRYDRL